jgi:hypothetical protein
MVAGSAGVANFAEVEDLELVDLEKRSEVTHSAGVAIDWGAEDSLEVDSETAGNSAAAHSKRYLQYKG